MENKVLVNLIIPEIEQSFDIFLPVNEVIWRVKKMLVKSVGDITNTNFNAVYSILVNKDTNMIYKNNEIIINTDIRNASELILLLKKTI